jgi:hypothetical protein
MKEKKGRRKVREEREVRRKEKGKGGKGETFSGSPLPYMKSKAL